MLLPLKNISGEQVGEIEVSDAVFAAPVNNPLMHQALVRQLSNARQGTHSTKTRGEVAGGGRKPFRQKGTGRARQGSIRASQWVGGGTVFGPRPRKYIKHLPKKMNAAALRSALSVKAAADQIMVVDALPFETPKTKSMVQALRSLGVNSGSVLLVVAEQSVGVQRSASNLPNVKTILCGYLNIRDLLGHDKLLLSKDALEAVELWLLPANSGAGDDAGEDTGDNAVAEESTPEGTEG
jgi:large subunit ribosomal protein L4